MKHLVVIDKNLSKKYVKFLLQGSIDFDVTNNINKIIINHINEGYINVVLNLKKVSYIDSIGLGMVVLLFKPLKEKNGGLSLINIPEKIKRLLRVTGLEFLISQDSKIIQNLKILSNKSKITKNIKHLFRNYGLDIEGIEKQCCIAILLHFNDKSFYISTLDYIEKTDIIKLEEWGKNQTNKLQNNMYKLILSNNLFIFNKGFTKDKSKIFLVGLLLPKRNDLRFLSVVSHSEQILEELR